MARSIGVGVYIIAAAPMSDATGPLLDLAPRSATPMSITRPRYFLLALIYGVPWIIMAQLIAEMIFVGLTSWQHDSRTATANGSAARPAGSRVVAVRAGSSSTFLVLVARRARAWHRRRNTTRPNIRARSSRLRRACSARVLGKSGKTGAPTRTPRRQPGRNDALAARAAAVPDPAGASGSSAA